MKLGMVQMSMTESVDANEEKILAYIDQAQDCDLLFFPEVQYSPFFAQYKNKDVHAYLMNIDDPRIQRIQEKAKQYGMYISPNVYLNTETGTFDTNLWITPDGMIEDKATMVHILDAENFWEKGYYTPSEDGFKVFDTPHGKVGIVICFDRHLPESIRTCALKGADLVIVPTANITDEPLDLFEAEMRTQAMQNQVFIAMCNRTGKEGTITFAGESILIHPSGNVIQKADENEQLITCDINLAEAEEWKKKRPFLSLRRKDMYL